MKPHQHVLASVGYGLALAGLGGWSVTDPWLYVAAVAGGEVIDLVDHPLYHLVYRRKNPPVLAVRRARRNHGLRRAWHLARQLEDSRAFVGLALHRLPTVGAIVALCSAWAIALPGGPYVFCFMGALLLHVICDITGDFAAVGHADNWMRGTPVPVLRRIMKTPTRTWRFAASIAILMLSTFALVSVRAVFEFRSPGAGVPATYLDDPDDWLSYVPLTILSGYLVLLALMVWLAGRKYWLVFGSSAQGRAMRVSVGSFRQLAGLATGRVRRDRRQFERLLLLIQADQAPWTIIVATVIAGLIAILNLAGVHSDLLLVLVPIAVAVTFNVYVHSTIGQIGGSLGAIASWWLNLLLARVGAVDLWSSRSALLVVVAAAGCWAFGLLSGVLLRGRIRMSAICFAGLMALPDHATPQTVDLASLGASILGAGHDRARGILGEATIRPGSPSNGISGDLYSGLTARATTTSETCRASIEDTYNPFLREVNFLLRGASATHGGSSSAIPVLPRHRVSKGREREADLIREPTAHQWQRQTASPTERLPVDGLTDMLAAGTTKTWSECLDHFNTRYTNIRTDLFLDVNDQGVWVSGITREVTSTKEYATAEAEVYASEVLRTICIEPSASRVTFPRASIFDVEVLERADRVPAYACQLSPEQRQSLDRLHEPHARTLTDRITTTITANGGTKLLVVLVQLVAGGAVGAAANQL